MIRCFRQKTFDQLEAERHCVADKLWIVVAGERRPAGCDRIADLLYRKSANGTATGYKCEYECAYEKFSLHVPSIR